MDFKCPQVCYNVELSLMYTILYVVLTYAKQTSENNHMKKMMIPLGQCKTIVPNLKNVYTSISYIRHSKRKIDHILLNQETIDKKVFKLITSKLLKV